MKKLKELKILLLEDIEEEAGLIERALRKEHLKFTAIRVDSRKEFIEAIDQFNPDVILSDHALPQFNSIEALSICRERGLPSPFILVTGTVSEEFAVNCLKQGVDDYILKTNLSRLPAAIVNALQQREAEMQKMDAELQLRRQNEELLKTNDQLRKTNMELDNFVYSVSHNLRAPLMSVLGLINLAKLENGDAEVAGGKHLKMMEQSMHRLDDTLKEILDYSRNSRTKVNIAKVDLKNVFQECVSRLRYVRDFDQVQIEFMNHAELPFYSDEYRIRTIFENIVSNSIKYRDVNKENPFLHIHATVEPSKAILRFIDNGIGIRQAHLSKIFNMFYRATDLSDGAGLGLYIVKECVEKLNGMVQVESREGQGSAFEIILPNVNEGQ